MCQAARRALAQTNPRDPEECAIASNVLAFPFRASTRPSTHRGRSAAALFESLLQPNVGMLKIVHNKHRDRRPERHSKRTQFHAAERVVRPCCGAGSGVKKNDNA